MNYISADYIFDAVNENFLQNYVLVVKDEIIVNLLPKSELSSVDIQHFDGILSPGFVNAHCHLELSHLSGIIETGTGLLPFLKKVVGLREFPLEQILEAIRREDQNMSDSGIVAVGDISNATHTAELKMSSQIRYYSFIEMFDFLNPSMTDAAIEQYQKTYDAMHESGSDLSYSPHAPYTVSGKLFEFIKKSNKENKTISIHNQETVAENELFMHGKGDFLDFYNGFGIDFQGLEELGKSSIHYALKHMDPEQRTLFVHNTHTNKEDILSAHQWSENVFWVTCPNANLYIENQLPNYSRFIDLDAKMCIGTDSLSSNWKLDVWEEIKIIRKYNSWIPIEKLLKWATLNGAEALGMDDVFGSFEVGKRPGLVYINFHPEKHPSDFQGSSGKLLRY